MQVTNKVLRIIDRAIVHLAQTYKFGYFEFEDMMQEGRLEALRVLDKFDDTKGCSLEQFIRVHVRNRFMNLHRDKVERRESPCQACEQLEGEDSCLIYQDRAECEKWAGWVNRNTAKRTLSETYDSGETNQLYKEESEDTVVSKEIIEMIERRFPLALRADYRRYLEGVKLPKHRKLKVIEEIQRIYGEETKGAGEC